MNPLSLRIDCANEDKAKIAAERFMQSLARRRFSEAARSIHERVMWFGEEISRERWIERSSVLPKMEIEYGGEVAPLSRFDPSIFGGDLEENDRVHLFHLAEVSVGLLIRDAAVLRVFDPRPLSASIGSA